MLDREPKHPCPGELGTAKDNNLLNLLLEGVQVIGYDWRPFHGNRRCEKRNSGRRVAAGEIQ